MKLIIIGGVAGGASAAARARRLDENAQIVLFERGADISFANCGLPYHIGGVIPQRENLLVMTPERFTARTGIDVRVRQEVTEIDPAAHVVTVKNLATGETYAEQYDKLILAPGSSPLRPEIPGIGDADVMTLWTLGEMDWIKARVDAGAKRAVVVGGGFIGLEVAENLRQRGVAVTLVELLPQVLPTMDAEMAAPLADELARNGVELLLGTAVAAVRRGTVDGGQWTVDGGRGTANELPNREHRTVNGEPQTGATAPTTAPAKNDTDHMPLSTVHCPPSTDLFVELADGRQLPADFVVMSVGVRPNAELARSAGLEIGARGGIVVNSRLQTSHPDIYAVGDAIQVTDGVLGTPAQIPLAGPANRQGRLAADNALGATKLYRGTFGAAVVKLFGLTAASVGATEKSLKKAGVAYEKIYTHPFSHATYYPGAKMLHLKLLFTKDGRLLGAQAVGTEGVDKRMDVLATALRGGMSVFDLEELELCYAPPYSSAKDPVNFLGFVAGNVLRGETRPVYADALPAGALRLDVREPAELLAGALPGAVNIPLGQLRQRLGELPKEREIVAYCAVGIRGYLAERTLRARGYNVRNLSGGYTTWRMFHKNDELRMPNVECSGGNCPMDSQPPARTETAPEAQARSRAAVGQDDRDEAAVKCAAELDVRGMQCPGPVVAVRQQLDALPPGGTLKIVADVGGFSRDLPAFCGATGNILISMKEEDGIMNAIVSKGAGCAVGEAMMKGAAAGQGGGGPGRTTLVLFSNDLDKALAAMILATGFATLGQPVTIYFTFWGLNVLRKEQPPPVQKDILSRMFGFMMPRGAKKLALSKMHMMGMGTAMMKHVMSTKGVLPLPELMRQAQGLGVQFIACEMAMNVMGLQQEEFIDGVATAGVAEFAALSAKSTTTLFI